MCYSNFHRCISASKVFNFLYSKVRKLQPVFFYSSWLSGVQTGCVNAAYLARCNKKQKFFYFFERSKYAANLLQILQTFCESQPGFKQSILVDICGFDKCDLIFRSTFGQFSLPTLGLKCFRSSSFDTHYLGYHRHSVSQAQVIFARELHSHYSSPRYWNNMVTKRATPKSTPC